MINTRFPPLRDWKEDVCKWGGKHTGGCDFIAQVSFLKLGSK